MLDFLKIRTAFDKKEVKIIPDFNYIRTKDLLIKSQDFYAVYNANTGFWTKSEQDLVELIDNELNAYYNANKQAYTDYRVNILYLRDTNNGMIDKWHKFCKVQMRDNFVQLDCKVLYDNDEITREDYATFKLPYSLSDSEPVAWNELISSLYDPYEQQKIEWFIGCLAANDVINIEKFAVFYGQSGTGKSTILKIIRNMFKPYSITFDAKSIGKDGSEHCMEQFKNNPLLAIQEDGDLSKIEDNTRLNSLASHEYMPINPKGKAIYYDRFYTLMLLGSNKPVRITDAKSGIIRRLIDIHPSGRFIETDHYKELNSAIKFEYGAIANKCKTFYIKHKKMFNDYIPESMLIETNPFYYFVLEYKDIFEHYNQITQKEAWETYKQYVSESKLLYSYNLIQFRNEFVNYWDNFYTNITIGGNKYKNLFVGFKTKMFTKKPIKKQTESWLKFSKNKSLFDIYGAEYYAQYANAEGTPITAWDKVETKLKDLDTTKLHYVRVPSNHIVIDFDIKDESGNKSLELNMAKAKEFPPTYAELSKSGQGIHLHYIYDGDVSELAKVYNDDIEIKVFNGKSSLRRMLTKCNDIQISHISSGLPIEVKTKMINKEEIKSEQHLKQLVLNCINKKYHPNTKPSVDFIYKLFDDAYKSGMSYDLSGMYDILIQFASSSTHQSDNCIKMINSIHLRSKNYEQQTVEAIDNTQSPICFFDVETFPNLFLVCYKFINEDKVYHIVNPTPDDIEKLFSYRLIGFNNRKYDNHMLYGCYIGYNNEQLFNLSVGLIDGNTKATFGGAYNKSYTDIYDYCGNTNKMSLKKWEIKLGLPHMEMDWPWDQPIPENLWNNVIEYCSNDVRATEAVWNATQVDFEAREILADIAGCSVNTSTNALTTKIIFGDNKTPNLVYTDLSKEFPGYEYVVEEKKNPNRTVSVTAHNMYRGIDLGFGGYVYANEGMYNDVALLDVASMHPHSIIALNMFGEYTKNFENLVDTRIYIKHKEFDKLKDMFSGRLMKYIKSPDDAKKLSNALKTAINSVYGLTSAKFDTPFRDKRNVNNIVALRGALFMKTLQDEVESRGFTVVHIKTDSIKIANATPEIIAFCMDFATKYKYTFEHEATYSKMCIVNGSTYIAKVAEHDGKKVDGDEWTATAAQFQQPYVFKKCFSKEPIDISDMAEVKESRTGPIYIAKDGQYEFIGKVGQFTPIMPGYGGGALVVKRNKTTKDGDVIAYDSVTGTKDYEWVETKTITDKHLEDYIDKSYYENLVKEAIDTISKYGNYEEFIK